MSRNLAQVNCAHCGGHVTHDEPPRPLTREDAGRYFDTQFAGMLVANATCDRCGARYLAWIDERDCAETYQKNGLDPAWANRCADDPGEHVDLSYRSSFNDEPGPHDIPEDADRRLALWDIRKALGVLGADAETTERVLRIASGEAK